MHLRGSVLSTGAACAVLLSLSGCAQNQVVPQLATTPNPFAYEKVSSLCQVAPLSTAPDGHMSVDMTVGSGEGQCAVSVSKGGGGSYVSFGVNAPPEHGKAFLYNYDGRTYITYTPVSAYDGEDHFGVELIPAHGQPRQELSVKVSVKAVGIAAKPAVAEHATQPAPKQAPTAGKKAVSHKIVRHHVVKKSAAK